MAWYWWLAIGLVAWLGISHFIGKPGFWKLTRRHPEAALQFFLNEPENWMVFFEEPPGGYRSVAPKEQWSGPFRMIVPSLPDPTVVVFGRYPDFEASQERFIKAISDTR